MPTIKLTKSELGKIKPGPKPYIAYDADLKGFGLRIMPSGTRKWVVEYRPHGGGRSVGKRRMTLGSISALTPEEARSRAKQILGHVALGNDPVDELNSRRRQLTVAGLIDQFEKEKPLGRRTGEPLRDRTLANMLARLRHHVVPILGARLASEIRTDDVSRLIRRVTGGDTAKSMPGRPRGRIIVRGGPGAARKVASDLSMIFAYAIDRGVVAANPVTTAVKPRAGKRQDYLRPDQMQKLGAAFEQLEEEGVNKRGTDILRLIILTGARPNEIEALRWSEVDAENGVLRLERSKTGFSVRPISEEALSIITAQPRDDGSPYVFPASRGGGYYTSSKKIWNMARSRAGVVDMARYHARHAVGTLSLSAGNSPASVAALLGHKIPRTTLSTYAHVVDEDAARAAQQHGKQSDPYCEGK